MRKKILVSPRFQIGFILYSMLSSLFIGLAFGAAFWVHFSKLENLGRSLGFDTGNLFFQYLDTQWAALAKLMVLVTCVCLLISTLLGLLISHRVVGPLRRLKDHIEKDSINGKVTPLQFRKYDFFSELSIEYQGLAKKIEEKDHKGTV